MSDTTARTASKLCERCGAFGDVPHGWVEGDCVLPHRSHSRKLVEGGLVCQPCADRWVEWLDEVIELYGTLESVLYVGGASDPAVDRVSHGKRTGSPSPIRLTAWALYWNEVNDHIEHQDGSTTATYLDGNLPDIPAVLAGWAQAIYEDRYDGTSIVAFTAYAGAAWLKANITTVAASPLLDDFDTELKWVRRALRQAHGITDPEPMFACLEVDCAGYVWPMSAGAPACDHCHRRYGTLDQVRALGYAIPERRRLTAAIEGPGRA